MATDTTYKQADSDNNLLRKVLTRLNEGIPIDAIHFDNVNITQPLGVFPDPSGALWHVTADAPLPVSFPQPILATVGGTVAVSSITNPVAVSSIATPVSIAGTVPVSVAAPVSIAGTVPVSIAAEVPISHITDPVTVTIPDTLDAFSRLRVATPTYVFDSQLTYEIPPLVYETIVLGTGATVAHDSTNRSALMTFASTPTGGKSFLQSFECFRYQPGRSLEVFVTFNFIEAVVNTLKFIGYSDGVNGVELQQDGTTVQLALLSGTGNGNQIVTKANWNIDKLDGTGISGETLDLTKAQIFVIDIQALYTGRVRVGFDIDGRIVPVHEFRHANTVAFPYIQSANLPIRAGMTCTGTVSTTMRFVCASVSSNGGQEDIPGLSFSISGAATAGNGTRVHLLSVRPRATFNSITTRSKFVLESIEITGTGDRPIQWELVLGQAISGTTAFTNVNTGYSTTEFNTAGTISGSPSIVLQSGYVAANGGSRSAPSVSLNNRYPITLDAAGVARSLGTLSLLVTGIGGTTAAMATFNWREIR